MGGVDKLDEILAYHNALQKGVYSFYHLIDIAVMNVFVI